MVLFCFVLFCSALPDVIQKEITPDHEFIVLACDGEYFIANSHPVTVVCH